MQFTTAKKVAPRNMCWSHIFFLYVFREAVSPKNVKTLPKITDFLTRPRETPAVVQPIKKRANLFSIEKDGKWTAAEKIREALLTTGVSSTSVPSDEQIENKISSEKKTNESSQN